MSNLFKVNISNYKVIKKAERKKGGYDQLVRDYVTFNEMKLSDEETTERLLCVAEIINE